MPIKRYFDDQNFERIKKDFTFLIQIIQDFKGELELAFRENYFNLYYRGNSAAKILFKKDGYYEIFINKKFYPKSINDDKRFSPVTSGDYKLTVIRSNLLHPFFQKKYLQELLSNIKKVSYSEELTFEQMLITDNLEREEIIIIDRQVTDKKLRRRRMDLLALKQVEKNKYNFVVLEVKMGNNPELKSNVAEQVEDYVKHIKKYFHDYKNCYEKQYLQKKKLGLIKAPKWESIDIINDVRELIIVGGYSGIAKEQIKKLKENNPHLHIKKFSHILDYDFDLLPDTF